jgi:hypothetical protein
VKQGTDQVLATRVIFHSILPFVLQT